MSSVFTGIALLCMEDFDINEILLNLRTKWSIKINSDKEGYEEKDNVLKFKEDDVNFMLVFSNEKLNDQEMIIRAKANYLCENLDLAVENMTSHISIVAESNKKTKVQTALLFNKVVSSIMALPDAIAVYTPFNVIGADDYIYESMFMKNDYLPIENLLYVGIVCKKDEYEHDLYYTSLYTIGMKYFDKKELEIIDSTEDIEKLRNRILNVAYYIIDNDKILSDGETIEIYEHSGEIKEKVKLNITIDDAIRGQGKTIKIEKVY